MGFRFTYLSLFSSIAFIASYSIVRGCAIFMGGFPNEMGLLVELFTDADMPPVSMSQIFYFLLIMGIWTTLTFRLITK